MRKLVVLSFVSLDGVMQAPGGKGEDPSSDFQFEGWTVPFWDEASGAEMRKQMGQPFDLLLGRKTYDIFASFWPKQEGEIAKPLNDAHKYVVTRGELEPTWKETTILTGDVAAEIKQLKEGDGPMLQVHGSGDFIQTLLANDLIDELWLKTFPVLLGKGKRLFGEGTRPAGYKLTESLITPAGVVMARYQREGDVKTGSFS